jgi:hypothetical protein
MMPINEFIDQLIQLGLADSFLDVINKHYLKVTEVYNLISFIDENNVRDVYLINDGNSDGINVIIELYNPVELENDNIYTDELSIQIINDGNRIEIAVVNNYESEEEIYENRLGRHEKNNCRKWS